jgi:hypothetical protein
MTEEKVHQSESNSSASSRSSSSVISNLPSSFRSGFGGVAVAGCLISAVGSIGDGFRRSAHRIDVKLFSSRESMRDKP